MLASQDVNPEISVNPAADEAMPAAAGGAGIGISLPRTILPDAIISKRLHGKTAFVIPALSVTLHTVHLPVRGQAQKLAALPYALEEDIGRPEAEIHHALCGASADGAMLAAAVSREAMTLAVDAADGAPVTPEHFLLPVPAPAEGEGGGWIAWREGDLVLVRASDGTGFGARADMLAALWAAAGWPAIDSYGAALPAGLPAQRRSAEDLPPPGPLPNLRQGDFAPPQRLRAPAIALALTLLLALAGHLGLAFADLQRQRATVETLRAEASELLARNVPGARVTDDPRLLYRRLAAGGQEAPGFLAVLARASEALAATPVQLSNLNWSGRDAALTLEAEAQGIDVLQAAEAALRAANLDVAAGAVTAGGGSARMTLTVRSAQ
ncbi:type II secretion system protein GspL [Marinovum sp. PR37]